MRFFETLAVAALAGSAAASPAVVVRNGVEARAAKKECLCQADVDLIVSHYKDILTLWKPEYKDWLSEEFYDKSESINNIAGLPFGSTIFPSKAAFVGYQTNTVSCIYSLAFYSGTNLETARPDPRQDRQGWPLQLQGDLLHLVRHFRQGPRPPQRCPRNHHPQHREEGRQVAHQEHRC
jgi:hypothetical protein